MRQELWSNELAALRASEARATDAVTAAVVERDDLAMALRAANADAAAQREALSKRVAGGGGDGGAGAAADEYVGDAGYEGFLVPLHAFRLRSNRQIGVLCPLRGGENNATRSACATQWNAMRCNATWNAMQRKVT